MVTFTPTEKEQLFACRDRFLYNEKQQLAGRRIKFDTDAVQRVASSVVNAECTAFVTLAEGAYNKLYTLGFSNGQELIFRVPFPIAGPSHLVTASEVATMEFMRETLGAPVPRVLAWSSNTKTNAIGSEFILMEKVAGTPFGVQWTTICSDNIDDFVRNMVVQFALLQSRSGVVGFSQIGSLYFKEDVSKELQSRPLFSPHLNLDENEKLQEASNKYRVGPIAHHQWWRCERAQMELDRGPWPDAASYYRAAVEIEIAFIKSSYATNAEFRRTPFHSIDAHLKLLKDCLKVIPYIIPPEEYSYPTLWHPDPSDANIMTKANFEITGLIDWQHSVIAPYFQHHTEIPSAFAYNDGIVEIPSEGYPTLPPNFKELEPEVQDVYRVHTWMAMRQRIFEETMDRGNRNRAEFVSSVPSIVRLWMSLPEVALRTWSDGLTNIRTLLSDLTTYWPSINDEPCPVQVTSEEREEWMEEHERATRYCNNCEELRAEVGCQGDGLITSASYEDAMKLVVAAERSWVEEEKGGPFPYKEGAWSFYLN
ncbi:hypothetical protein C8Q75DRAFT_812214 [Abortiporus biennis]|nr:hypothetical protein C8Q75DRAFT_812214 [Abortiporus biennis]